MRSFRDILVGERKELFMEVLHSFLFKQHKDVLLGANLKVVTLEVVGVHTLVQHQV